jgi:hypothetical protein
MQLLKDASRGRDFSVILCDDKDRFGRFDSIDHGYYVKPLRDAGLRLETVAQGKIDWNTFAGRITDAALQEAKKTESLATSRRVMTRMLMKAKRGQWTGGFAPYGFDLADDPELGKRLVLGDPRKVRVIKLIFEWYAYRGHSMEDIRKELDARCVLDPHGRTTWNKCTIRAILRNRKYVGDMVWNTRHEGKYSDFAADQVKTSDRRIKRRNRNPEDDWVVVPQIHEAIVDRQTFEDAQARIIENRKRKTPLPRGGDFILSDLLICGHCGARMGACNNYGLKIYYCSTYARNGKGSCGYNRIREDKLVPCIVNKLLASALDKEAFDRLRTEMRQQLDTEAVEVPDQVKDLRQRIGQLDQNIAKGGYNITIAEPEDMMAISQNLKAMRLERIKLIGELDRLDRDVKRVDAEETLRTVEEQLWQLRESLAAADPRLVRESLRQMVGKVEVWFTHKPSKAGKLTKSTFARGLIWVRTDEPLMMGGVMSPAMNGWCWPSLPPVGSSTCSRARSSARA